MSVTPSSTVVGVFTDRSLAEQAMEALYSAGFGQEQIRYSAPGTSGGFFEGLKNFFAGSGPSSAAVAHALSDMGLSDEEAQYYANEYDRGNTVLTVTAPGREQEILSILYQYGAYNARTKSSQSSVTTDVAPQSSDAIQPTIDTIAEPQATEEHALENNQQNGSSAVNTSEHQVFESDGVPTGYDTVEPVDQPIDTTPEYTQAEVAAAEPETVEVVASETGVAPIYSEVMPAESDVTSTDFEVAPAESDVTPAEVVSSETEVTPVETDVVPAEAEVVALETDTTPVEQTDETSMPQDEVAMAEPQAVESDVTTAEQTGETPQVGAVATESDFAYQAPQTDEATSEDTSDSSASEVDAAPIDLIVVEQVDVVTPDGEAWYQAPQTDAVTAEDTTSEHAPQSEVIAPESEATSEVSQVDAVAPDQEAPVSETEAAAPELVDEHHQLHEQLQSYQAQLEEAKAQLQAAKDHEAQLQAAKEREQHEQKLQSMRQQLQSIQAELQATLAELQDTKSRISQYQ